MGVLPARMAGDRKYRKDKEIISEFDSHTKGKAILTVDVIPDQVPVDIDATGAVEKPFQNVV